MVKGTLLSLSILLVLLANASALDFANNIYLNSGPIAVKALQHDEVKSLTVSHLINRDNKKAQYIFHFKLDENESREDMLAKKHEVEKYLGVNLVNYIPHNAYRVSVEADSKLLQTQQLVSGLSIVKVEPVNKVSNSLSDFQNYITKDETTVILHAIMVDSTIVSVENINVPAVSIQQDDENLYITVKVADALEAAKYLSNFEDVLFVGAITMDKPMNLNAGLIDFNGALREDKYLEQVRKHLNGSLELITVADSGLDLMGCYFHDTKKKFEEFYDYKTPAKPSTHRKVEGYMVLMDKHANLTHGTHVAGTVAGFSTCSKVPELSEYNGIAPAAKLLFTDVGCDVGTCHCPEGVKCGCGEEGCKSGQLGIPLNYGDHLFAWSAKSGSLIHTNSWGSSLPAYDSTTQKIDAYAASAPQHLILFAAGNSNDTVGPQATAKNIITVGSSDTDYSTFKKDHYEIINYDQLAKDTYNLLDQRMGEYCKSIPEDSWTENCKFLNEKTINSDTCCKYAESNANCGIEIRGSEFLRCCKKCNIKYSEGLSKTIHHSNVSFFSSHGPTADGRIKPDFVVPGHELISARSHFPQSTPDQFLNEKSLHHHLEGMRGTSMATPNAAALSALVRQYYRQGYHNDGKDGFVPSAALIKATLINAAAPLKENTTYPDARAGFGRVQFNESIPILDVPSKLSLIAHDNVTIGEKKEYLFNIYSDSRPLQITLVWTDPVADLASKIKLVNDLDLIVTDPNGKKVYGNSKTEDDIDNLNNVEKVRIEEPVKGIYVVEVLPKKEADKKQAFSIVYTGHLISLNREDLAAAKKVKLIVMITVIVLTVVTIAAFVVASLIQRRRTQRAGYTQIE